MEKKSKRLYKKQDLLGRRREHQTAKIVATGKKINKINCSFGVRFTVRVRKFSLWPDDNEK